MYEISTTITTEKGEQEPPERESTGDQRKKVSFFSFSFPKKIENKDVQRSEAGSTGDRRKDVD